MPRKVPLMTVAAGTGAAASVETVPDDIYNAVMNAILDRALDPGTKLPEDVFCAHYGVSRTIVRIGIQRLQQDRLVELQRFVGSFVVVPDRTDARDILAARKAIEPYIVKRLVGIASDADLSALKLHVEAEDDAYGCDDRREALRLSCRFHILLSRLADNRVLESYIRNLICRSSLVIATYSDVTGCCKAHDHRRLIDLMMARDAHGAAAEMERHIEKIEADLLQNNSPGESPSLESVLARYAGRSVTDPHVAEKIRAAR